MSIKPQIGGLAVHPELGIFWDESGAPYLKTTNGSKSYLSPLEAAGTPDPRVQAWGEAHGAALKDATGGQLSTIQAGIPKDAGMFKTGYQFNPQTGQFENSIDWDAILSASIAGLLTGNLAGTAFAGAAGPEAAGGSDAAGGILPSTSIPISTGMGAVPAAITGDIAAGGGDAALTAAVNTATKGGTAAAKGAGKTGMDSSDLALLVSSLGGSLLSGLLGNGIQQRKSFEGTATDPRNMASELHGLLSDQLDSREALANEPVKLRTTVNPLPSYRGGGLPTSISAVAQDPALGDPSQLTFNSPVQFKRRTLPGSTGGSGTGTGSSTGNGSQAATGIGRALDNFLHPNSGGQPQSAPASQQASAQVGSPALDNYGGDQVQAAIDLLMHATKYGAGGNNG